MKLFYIRGLISNKNRSSSMQLLREYFPNYELIEVEYGLEDDISVLESQIISHEDYEEGVIFGNSLGGWYGIQLAAKLHMKFIGFNPSFHAYESLAKYNLLRSIRDKFKDCEISQCIDSLMDYGLGGLVIVTDDKVVDYIKTLRLINNRIGVLDVGYISKQHVITDDIMEIMKRRVDGYINHLDA